MADAQLMGVSTTASAQALELLLAFAERTGLSSDAPPERYLWTDAFAVCTLLGLGQTDLALRLVDQVHRVLGRHRSDDPREGPIGGLSDADAEAHPTAGGLRIGKRLPERNADELTDDRGEWDRDGQYFHYLTRWMHALDQVSRWTGDETYRRWARELADVAHKAFVHDTPFGRRMVWKMSVDLSRPLVASMGHHDPLDGYCTGLQLDADAAMLADFAAMIPDELDTTDPLGIGGLLTDAWRLERLRSAEARPLRDRVLDAAFAGLRDYARFGELDAPASGRLGFRELGLSIGLAAVPRLAVAVGSDPRVKSLEPFVPMRERIESFWLEPRNRRAASWVEHENINEVMLATSLAPDGYLGDASAR